MDTGQSAPHNAGDQRPVPAEIMPGRAQAQQHDAVGGNRIEKGQPAIRQVKRGDHHIDQQRHKPYQNGRKTKDDILVCLSFQGFFRYLPHGVLERCRFLWQGVGIFQQVFHTDLKLLRQLHQRQHIRNGFTPFPFGNSLVRIIQLLRQPRLCQAGTLAIGSDIGSNLQFQLFAIHVMPPG